MSYEYKYPHPAVTVDCIVFTSDNKVLLIQRKFEPCKGKWAFPGGFMNIDETAEQAVVRELAEETTIEIAEMSFRLVPIRLSTVIHANVLSPSPISRR